TLLSFSRSVFFFFYSFVRHFALHSFPTRRSSDLRPALLRCVEEASDRTPRPVVDRGVLRRWLPPLSVSPICRIETSGAQLGRSRSEEHTSELQSLAYLVCRLLLEKKKTNTNRYPP